MSIQQEVDYCHINGLLLSGTYLPDEIVIAILSFIPWKNLPTCREVCRLWRSLIDHEVSEMKIKRECIVTYRSSFTAPLNIKHKSIPFYLKYAISQNVFGTNLLSDFFGKSRTMSVMWRATLKSFGLNAKIMDEIQPHLEIFIWYCSYLTTNSIRISLLDGEGECVFYYFCKSAAEEESSDWQKVFYTFKDYGPGVRYIQFEHGRWDFPGGDRYCLRSSYKIANLWLVALIPSPLFLTAAEQEKQTASHADVSKSKVT